VAWSVFQTASTRLVLLAVFLVLARILSPDDFGLVSLATVFVGFFGLFVEQGFAQAIIQRRTLEPGHLDSAFWLCASLGLVLTGVAFALAAPISDLIGQPDFAPLMRGLSPTLFIGGLASTPEAILKRDLAFRSLAVRTVIGSVAGGVVGVLAAVLGAGAWSLVLQLLVQTVVSTIVLWLAVPWRPGFDVSMARLRELFSFGINIIGMSFLNFLNRRSDDFLIAAVLGTTALGYYTVAYRILLLTTEVMTQTIDAVTLPTFARVQDDLGRLRDAYLMATRISSSIGTPVFIGLAAAAPQLIPVVFGAKWEPAVGVAQILGFIGVVHASLYFNDSVLVAIGRPRDAVVVTAISAFANVVAFAATVHWGIEAVAAAYVIRGYLLSPVWIQAVRRYIPFSVGAFLRLVGTPFVWSLLMGVAMVGTRALVRGPLGEGLTLLAMIAVGLVAYPAAMWLFARRFVLEMVAYLKPAIPFLARLPGSSATVGG
jgi:PST family polysaccharide transporter